MSSPMLTPAQRDRDIARLREAIHALERMPVVTPCAECENFRAGFCTQWSATVPAEAQASGCEQWQEAVPF